MKKNGKDREVSALIISSWVNLVIRSPFLTISFVFLLTTGVLAYTVSHFKINSDFNALVSHDAPFRKIKREFNKAFPMLSGTLVVVIDAETPEQAMRAHDRLTERLKKETGPFKYIYQPGGGEFFKKNGLLYKDIDELEDLADNLADVQPFLGLISDDLSLRGFFSTLEKVIRDNDLTDVSEEKLAMVFDRLIRVFDSVADETSYQLSWQEIMMDETPSKSDLRKFIVLKPVEDPGIFSIKEGIALVRRIAKESLLDENHGVKVRITGSKALDYENLLTVRKGMGIALMVSICLVGIVLYIGLGSGRLVFASLLTLMTGLIWTTGFAIGGIGHLNLISITFAVLFVGLGIDFSIQLCLRFRELMDTGLDRVESITGSALGVGKSLLICTVTTAIGFYAFIPTAYAGVSELGMISGTGMFISFLANLTLLPALLILMPHKKSTRLPFPLGETLLRFPYTYARGIALSALFLGLGAIFLFPRVFFNYNPLSLYDPAAESVITANELFETPETSPWTASVLAGNAKEAHEIASSLSELKEVDKTIALPDFIPEEQQEKLDVISDMALFLPDTANLHITSLDVGDNLKALGSFEMEVKQLLESEEKASLHSIASRLLESIVRFKEDVMQTRAKGISSFSSVEHAILGNLPVLLETLEFSLMADEFDQADLPGEVTERYKSREGHFRVQVIPDNNITNRDAHERFVNAVYSRAPNATDAPVVILETGRTIISSFRQATLSALVVITVFLFIILRSLTGTLLILVPLLLSVMLTAATSVLLNLPLNYANVIVVPLLLGIGVDNGIHFIHRYRNEPPKHGNMLKTSTSRSVFFSSLTTIMSFSSLSFSAHRGTASMGQLLTICMVFLIINTVVLLPALLKLFFVTETGKRNQEDV